MALKYHCPHCQGLLNPGTKVIFVVEREGERGLLLLSPELGDYAVVLAESLPIRAGHGYRFRCPICHHALTSPVSEKLVEIVYREPDGSEVRVDFSCIAGEHATFVCGPKGLRAFGEHAGRYAGVNFFGVGGDDGLA